MNLRGGDKMIRGTTPTHYFCLYEHVRSHQTRHHCLNLACILHTFHLSTQTLRYIYHQNEGKHDYFANHQEV